MIRLVTALSIICALGFATSAFADETAPANLANNCFACHGPGGKSTGGIPSIGGQTAAELSTKLNAFKTNSVQGTIMNRVVQGFSQPELDAIAKYIGALK